MTVVVTVVTVDGHNGHKFVTVVTVGFQGKFFVTVVVTVVTVGLSTTRSKTAKGRSLNGHGSP